MSAEQVAMCDDTARAGTNDGRIIRNLCASHEALRALRKSDGEWAALKFARLLEFAERLDSRRMHAVSEELFALLRS
jgi:hypothetical protein